MLTSQEEASINHFEFIISQQNLIQNTAACQWLAKAAVTKLWLCGGVDCSAELTFKIFLIFHMSLSTRQDWLETKSAANYIRVHSEVARSTMKYIKIHHH